MHGLGSAVLGLDPSLFLLNTLLLKHGPLDGAQAGVVDRSRPMKRKERIVVPFIILDITLFKM